MGNTSITDSKFKKIICGSFFVLMLLYHELLLHCFLYSQTFFSLRLAIIILSAVGTGLIMTVIIMLLPSSKIVNWVFGLLTFCSCAYVSLEYCLKGFFGTYFSIAHAFHMAPEIMNNYSGDVTGVITAKIGFILLTLIPFVIYIILNRRIINTIQKHKACCLKMLIPAAVFQIAALLLIFFYTNSAIYTYDFSTDRAIDHYGLCTDVEFELSNRIFGPIEESFSFFSIELKEKIKYNVTDLDFNQMAKTEIDPTVKSLDKYFASIEPSPQNAYTGVFKDKNLILITAESFCPYLINEKLTPALYRLTHEGFIVEDCYQPLWGQSTTGGEYCVMTGMIPAWIDENSAFSKIPGKTIPYALGWQLKSRGYTTVAYHDGTFDFYDRNLTHPALGYDFSAQGGTVLTDGTVFPTGLTFSSGFPSDVELFRQTMPSLIQNYVENGQMFHAYYMTVSGHGQWSWEHGTAQKNRQVIQENYPNLSETSQAYLAANIELEYALSYLLSAIEKAGIAENTVIAMASDHYPYFMIEDEADYYNELRGFSDSEADISRYKNNMILWCGSMKKSVKISTPCDATSLFPTLLNLFGIAYDSRLISGRDLLAEDLHPNTAYNGMPVAVIPTASGTSWKTASGTYESSTGVFTPKEGVTLDSNYAPTVNQIVRAKYTYAGTVIQTNYFKTAMDALKAQTEKKGTKKGDQKNKSETKK